MKNNNWLSEFRVIALLKWLADLAFLVDLTGHLNVLSKCVEGKDGMVSGSCVCTHEIISCEDSTFWEANQWWQPSKPRSWVSLINLWIESKWCWALSQLKVTKVTSLNCRVSISNNNNSAVSINDFTYNCKGARWSNRWRDYVACTGDKVTQKSPFLVSYITILKHNLN